MQSHQALLEDFPLTRMIEVPAIGNSGGIVVLWDDTIWELDEIATTTQEVHAIIKVHSLNITWLFSVIYASTHRNMRKTLWNNLKNIKDTFDGKWLIGGDFNELLHNSEKKGGNPLNASRVSNFQNTINHCELIVMGFKGSRYTWLNKRFKKRNALIFERLDRFLANNEWLLCYPNAQVQHLQRTHSDHTPLLMTLTSNLSNVRDRPFRLETMWMSHPDVIKIVDQAWNRGDNLLGSLVNFESELTGWAKKPSGIFSTGKGRF
ncbi:hypothetical protein R3W88_004544 [Solanum pinnatisectum]|uniref:Endonuclease/exonuclease/phosphatase domain-containing protein n=1 Tax=Solanum pinnatisectum TaxID=50273 RepID=A0AAV9KA13_9SOLN|nr:hypothetical protein R3W88_004544 [Solanum pinnatisectum]